MSIEYLLRNFLICNKLLYHFYSLDPRYCSIKIIFAAARPFPSSESNSPLDRPQNKSPAARSSSVLLATSGRYISPGVLFLSRARWPLILILTLFAFSHRIVQYEKLLTRLYYIKVRLSILGHISASFPDISFSEKSRGITRIHAGVAVKRENSR